MESVKTDKNSIKYQMLHYTPKLVKPSYIYKKFSSQTSLARLSDELSEIKSQFISILKVLASQDSLIQLKSKKIKLLSISSKVNKEKIRSLKLRVASQNQKILKFETCFNSVASPKSQDMSTLSTLRPLSKISSFSPSFTSTPVSLEKPKKKTKKMLYSHK